MSKGMFVCAHVWVHAHHPASGWADICSVNLKVISSYLAGGRVSRKYLKTVKKSDKLRSWIEILEPERPNVDVL